MNLSKIRIDPRHYFYISSAIIYLAFIPIFVFTPLADLLTDPKWALNVFTAGLLFVTLVYSVISWKKLRAEFRPVLSLSVEHSNPLNLKIFIRNIGKGAAKEIDAEWYFEELEEYKNSKKEWKHPNLLPEDEREFPLPAIINQDNEVEVDFNKKKIKQNLNKGLLKYRIEYKNALGISYSEEGSIELLELLEKKEDSFEVATKSEMQQIREGIEGLEEHVEKIKREHSDSSNQTTLDELFAAFPDKSEGDGK